MSDRKHDAAQPPSMQQTSSGNGNIPIGPPTDVVVGNIKVSVNDTPNTIRKKVIKDYIDTRQVKVPDPDETEKEVLAMLSVCYNAVNNLRKTHNVINKLKTAPDTLPNAAIAELIMNMYEVRLINTAGPDADTEYSLLGIYQESGPDEGLYITKDDVFKQLISRYNDAISDHDIDEVVKALRRKAFNKGTVERNSDKDLIAVNNGIFDYRTKTLMPFSPQYVFLTKSHVNYNPQAINVVIHNDADGTDWDVESWMYTLFDEDEMVDLIWQLLGAIIRPFVAWDAAAWFYSKSGNNGKGTLCELMRQLCGEGTCHSLPLADFGKDFMLEPLTRASAIVTDENDNVYLDRVANLKAIITGDVVMVNRKFKQAIAYRFRGFMVQCLNDLPRVRERGNAFFRRQIFVPFEKCFTGSERKYIKHDYLKRPEVLEYVLFKVLHSNYYDITVPEKCRQALALYKEYNDPLRQFVDEIMQELAWNFVPMTFLYDLYLKWHKRNYPTGQVSGKSTFREDLEAILVETGGWYFLHDKKTGRLKQQRPKKMMDNPEKLIDEYRMTEWMNQNYLGSTDWKKRCHPIFPKGRKFRGIYREGIVIDDSDDDEDPNDE